MSVIHYRDSLKPCAQSLRRNQTPEERRLWYDFLRQHPIQFRRQKQFGGFVVDFYCARAKLVVELDGSQHFEGEAIAYDRERTKYLEEQGLRVLRFSNNDVRENFEGVCGLIDRHVMASVDGGKVTAGVPKPSPAGEGGSAKR